MPSPSPHILPSLARQLAVLGENIRLARLRRKYSAEAVAKRAGISRKTLYRIEQGEASATLGSYASVLQVLGLSSDLQQVARDDELGRKLQDLNLPVRKRAPKKQRIQDA